MRVKPVAEYIDELCETIKQKDREIENLNVALSIADHNAMSAQKHLKSVAAVLRALRRQANPNTDGTYE